MPNRLRQDGLKDKDLVGIPWTVALALRADGWFLRRDIIWHKPNSMPESVLDRPSTAHEYLFLLSKAGRYYYDAAAIAEPQTETERARRLKEQAAGLDTKYKLRRDEDHGQHQPGANGVARSVRRRQELAVKGTRNARSVWTIANQPCPGAHFATFPEELPRRCILAGSAPGDTILDLFGGSGTASKVAAGHGRSSIYIDLNPAYLDLADQRIGPMLCTRA